MERNAYWLRLRLDFHSRQPIADFLMSNPLLPGHVADFQAGDCPNGDSQTFNRFPFGPTWSLTMIEQRGDREYVRGRSAFRGEVC